MKMKLKHENQFSNIAMELDKANSLLNFFYDYFCKTDIQGSELECHYKTYSDLFCVADDIINEQVKELKKLTAKIKIREGLSPMSEPKNIQISYNDFKMLLDVLEYIDMSNYAKDFQMQFEAVLSALQAKRNSIESRQAYTRLIQSNKTGDEGQKFEARAEYLRKKNQV